jgi:hypothetical protein
MTASNRVAVVHVPTMDDPSWEPTPRIRPSAFEAQRLANAFDDGWYTAVSRIFGAVDTDPCGKLLNEAHRTIRPTYAQLRDFLVGDNDVDYRIACRIALRQTSRHLMRVL